MNIRTIKLNYLLGKSKRIKLMQIQYFKVQSSKIRGKRSKIKHIKV